MLEAQLDHCGTLDSLYIEDLTWRQRRLLGMESDLNDEQIFMGRPINLIREAKTMELEGRPLGELIARADALE